MEPTLDILDAGVALVPPRVVVLSPPSGYLIDRDAIETNFLRRS
jgi:hypothetical protein